MKMLTFIQGMLAGGGMVLAVLICIAEKACRDADKKLAAQKAQEREERLNAAKAERFRMQQVANMKEVEHYE